MFTLLFHCSGVLPGLEAGLDHFDLTNSLLSQVCHAVSPIFYYTCLWECVTSNESIRLPAITYVIDHFNKRVGMSEQRYLIGRNSELMVSKSFFHSRAFTLTVFHCRCQDCVHA